MTLPFRVSLRRLNAVPSTHPGPAPSAPEWFTSLRAKLLSTPPLVLHDTLDPLQAKRLQTTLSSFLPAWATLPDVADISTSPLPLSHHLAYFNAFVPTADLLTDGTDPLQSPGPPFTRRMWAGGSLHLDFSHALRPSFGMYPMGAQWVCLERIAEVRGTHMESSSPKIFVGIERQMANLARISSVSSSAGLEEAKKKLPEPWRMHWEKNEHWREGWKMGSAVLVERRNIVFMKPRSEDEIKAAQIGEGPPIKYLEAPKETPDFAHTVLPTPHLLFRFSALTLNAHRIHLDPAYSLNVEGHRQMLVHGPLTLTFMLTLLHHHLRLTSPNEHIINIDYRNLAPLYCNEPMRICGRKKPSGSMHLWEVWIEGPTGGVAVKGTVRTAESTERIRQAVTTHWARKRKEKRPREVAQEIRSTARLGLWPTLATESGEIPLRRHIVKSRKNTSTGN